MKQQPCTEFQSLVPGYMDGELSEAQAAPLREHLLACLPCRSDAQGMTSLSHWFKPLAAPDVPAGFAGRVAQAAFASPTALTAPPEPERPTAIEASVLPFVLSLISVAAGLLLCLALFMAQEQQPREAELSAEPLPSILEELDRLNRGDQFPGQ